MPHEIAAALIVASGKVLLGLRASSRKFFPNVWDVFGGHVEPGEGHEAALLREVREELGITPTRWTFLETTTQPLASQPKEPPDLLIAHLYLVTAWSGTPVNRQPEEHSEIHWFTLAEAVKLELADPSYPELFARYLAPI
jgi:8-oxo-dGTP pyrophosphatase MutT (NUDIX family)